MEVDSAPTPTVTTSALQQFIILSKTSKGLAAVELIKQVLDHSQIYVFGELLRQPNIKELSDSSEHQKYYQLLELFAYGNYKDYDETKYPPLTPQMIQKLRHLTIVNLANKTKTINYSKLSEELGIDNLRELENLIIDVIYSGIIKGKMDQQHKWLEISSTISRDIKEEQLDTIINVLSDWCANCENVIADIETQINKANATKSTHLKEKQELEQQIANIEMHLKNATQDGEYPQDADRYDKSEMGSFMGQSHSMSQMFKAKRVIRRSSKPSGSTSKAAADL